LRRLLIPVLLLVFLAALTSFPPAFAQTEPHSEVTGLVDHSYNIALTELNGMPSVTETATVRCVGWPPDNPGINGYDASTLQINLAQYGLPIALIGVAVVVVGVYVSGAARRRPSPSETR
jgi:hypothetical protein